MNGRICLVTGASSGIGRATAVSLATMGATVVLVCLDEESGLATQAAIRSESGNASVDLLLADLTSQSSIRRLVTDFQSRYARLHVLINDAGGLQGHRVLTADNVEATLALNYLGPFLLTNLLVDRLRNSSPSRVVNVVTRLLDSAEIDFDNLQSEVKFSSFGAYTQAKLCDMVFTYELARRLAGSDVTVNCVHPGLTRSRFGRDTMSLGYRMMNVPFGLFIASPEKAAQRVLYLATDPGVSGISGKYFGDKRQLKSPAQSYEPAIARKLWEVSSDLVHLSEENVQHTRYP